ncbi:hypothetical protein [Spongiactinospora sp. TRM90649]|uniref:hypothetical protein n=1 Tax=Spongiactinospora sp. TRM90649 TaxID=3031114 RepID=UPI0023F922A5|nr:hypothetical protein [Spongiactinospora sp. TRM90649]MDF5751625.1 hypothetical protein [Spongiactinospora sp. TRM90649]
MAGIAADVRFLSAYGCSVALRKVTLGRDGLGAKRCSRATLLKRAKEKDHRPALITVHKGRIVQVQEIFTA